MPLVGFSEGMPSSWSRRGVLHGIGAALVSTASSGCVFGIADSPDAGTLVVRNDHADAQTVIVHVTKTSTSDDDTRPRDETPDPESTPIWERDEQFTVDAGETTNVEGFVTEPGAYYVEARTESGASSHEWVGFYEAADGGVAEDAIYVTIDEAGDVTVYASHSD